MSRHDKNRRAKLLASIGLISAAATVAGLGTFGTFTSTTTATQSSSTGLMALAIGSGGTIANRLTIGATGLVAGDTVQRVVTLDNAGSLALSAVTLTTTASPSSLLDTDTANGLQLVLDSCSVPWTEAGTAPAYTYTCSGGTTVRIASRPVIGANLDLGAVNSLPAAFAGGTDYLRVTLTLPASAPNTLMGRSSTITFSFTGVQRTATNK